MRHLALPRTSLASLRRRSASRPARAQLERDGLLQPQILGAVDDPMPPRPITATIA
jgi:hypothetical protein